MWCKGSSTADKGDSRLSTIVLVPWPPPNFCILKVELQKQNATESASFQSTATNNNSKDNLRPLKYLAMNQTRRAVFTHSEVGLSDLAKNIMIIVGHITIHNL